MGSRRERFDKFKGEKDGGSSSSSSDDDDDIAIKTPKDDKQTEVFDVALPPHLLATPTPNNEEANSKPIGPVLPDLEPEEFQVALPPNFKLAQGSIGPTLPPHLRHLEGSSTEPSSSNSNRVLGPSLPPGFVLPVDDSESEEDTSFGPDPTLMLKGEYRRTELHSKKEDVDKKVERESWMLELPPERAANLGLGARQFRAKLAPDMGDRSVWTDTPTDAAKRKSQPPKVDEKALAKQQMIDERDKEMERMARKAEKKQKRDESLLDLHRKKLAKKAKKEAKKMEGQPAERKRFSREDDLAVHKFDEAQKKAIFKKAQLLNDRFSKGESKYL